MLLSISNPYICCISWLMLCLYIILIHFQVPTRIAWDKTAKPNIDSDSLSNSSSTSSLDEIPHYILDSATSPETQTATGDKFIPRVEVRDTAGELMQIDSLMIVNGKYVGDPDDLKLLEKLPEGITIANNTNQQQPTPKSQIDSSNSKSKEIKAIIPTTPDVIKPLISSSSSTISQQSTTSITPVIKDEKPVTIITNAVTTTATTPTAATITAPVELKKNSIEHNKCDTNNKNNSCLDSILKYDYNKPDLKFDTKNENKLDTFRNLPLNIPKNSKPQPPNQLTFADNATIISDKNHGVISIDTDKTPTVANPPKSIPDDVSKNSDSETEITGQALTETELSDWTADDAVSENFVDIEFALNSNKGTIKRNKKHKNKKRAPIVTNEQTGKTTGEYIAGSLDFDNIEFMDTGSEDSCIETYQTINKAMLRNRGYVEFVDHHDDIKDYMQYKPDPGYNNIPAAPPSTLLSYNRTPIVEAINKDLPKINFIEQGACVLYNDFDLKTPINEVPPMLGGPIKNHTDHPNDMEEDSLLMIASQTTTTTEDSDALTVVTSPLDSNPERYDNFSSDSTKTEEKKIEIEKLLEKTINNNVSEKKEAIKTPEDMSYEEYVRQLQTKIREISSARDSLDMRKSRRKSSKGDEISVSSQILSNSTTPVKNLSVFQDGQPTVTKKLEEITKERTKQKDLIHDLVMDKLQTKKQLNAEKRLNRSRNRNNVIFSSSQVSQNPHGSDNYDAIPPEHRNSKPKESNERRHSLNTSVSPVSDVKESVRPLSTFVPTPKILKTQSFCVNSTSSNSRSPFSEFRTPVAPIRTKAEQTTDKIREDARQRARLKTNEDLGLSPEDKIQLLRKRYQLDMQHITNTPDPTKNKSDDMKFRERRLMSSKSVNDITTVHQIATELRKNYYELPQSTPQTPKHGKNFEFSSSDYDLKKKDGTSNSRKGLIQTVSDFFHKKKDSKESSKESSPTKDKDATTTADKTRFGLFRLSPRSKSKVSEWFSNIFLNASS